MRKKGTREILLCYLMEKSGAIGMYALMVIIFYVVCSLNQLDNSAEIFYAVMITAFCGMLYLSYHFYRYYLKVQVLYEMQANVEEAVRMLSRPQGLLEEEYQQAVRGLHTEWFGLQDKTSLRESEMSDYYLMWAHQIKTPIAAMKLLLEGEIHFSSGEGNFALLEELFKIEQYVEMVLHYLRLESIASDMVLKEYELQGLVRQALRKYAVLFINSKVQLQLEEFDCRVLTDEKWFSFMIEQILSNAVKYTVEGEIFISVEKEEKKQQSSQVLVIRDTGMGIRAEDLPRIFERGFTGYNGRMDKKSTGIGLYLCKQIADRLGHKIMVSSTQERGTCVFITLDRKGYDSI